MQGQRSGFEAGRPTVSRLRIGFAERIGCS
jgi:hypothetical protein